MKSIIPGQLSFPKMDPMPLEVVNSSQVSNNAQKFPVLEKRKLHLSFSSQSALHFSSLALLLWAILCELHLFFCDEEHLM